MGQYALSAMADTGRLNTILESMACWHKQWLHGKVRKRGASDVVREVGSTYLRLRLRASDVRSAIADVVIDTKHFC